MADAIDAVLHRRHAAVAAAAAAAASSYVETSVVAVVGFPAPRLGADDAGTARARVTPESVHVPCTASMFASQADSAHDLAQRLQSALRATPNQVKYLHGASLLMEAGAPIDVHHTDGRTALDVSIELLRRGQLAAHRVPAPYVVTFLAALIPRVIHLVRTGVRTSECNALLCSTPVRALKNIVFDKFSGAAWRRRGSAIVGRAVSRAGRIRGAARAFVVPRPFSVDRETHADIAAANRLLSVLAAMRVRSHGFNRLGEATKLLEEDVSIFVANAEGDTALGVVAFPLRAGHLSAINVLACHGEVFEFVAALLPRVVCTLRMGTHVAY